MFLLNLISYLFEIFKAIMLSLQEMDELLYIVVF